MFKRGSGILLHITSLPSEYGIGDLGPAACTFADFLTQAKQSYWQVLPLNPTDQAFGNSPYSISSAFAGNTNLISPELLVRDGLLFEKDVGVRPEFRQNFCDYAAASSFKKRLLGAAFRNFKKQKKAHPAYEDFCSKNRHWLEDFALFSVIKKRFNEKPWSLWDKAFRDRRPRALDSVKAKAARELEEVKFLQFIFFKQMVSLKRYLNERDIKLIGDMSIYVDYDSADVWVHNDIFKLDKNKNPLYVAGVPPDYFSKTGQVWGNPVYRWGALKKTGYKWWLGRVEKAMAYFDILRVDHFRGLVAYWEVPALEKTAVNGRWVEAPATDFINALLKRFKGLPIIAEDLGHITADVREVLARFKFPGMKVLLFAFDNDERMHPYLPHTYDKNWVVYTGTHDNNTVVGWFEREATPEKRKRVFRYFGRQLGAAEVNWEFIRLAMMSVADIAVFPLQDVLGLGEEARMNTPSTTEGNWEWRFSFEELAPAAADKLGEMTETYGRAL